MLKPPARVESITIVAEICRDMQEAIKSGNTHTVALKILEVARKLEDEYMIFHVVNN